MEEMRKVRDSGVSPIAIKTIDLNPREARILMRYEKAAKGKTAPF